MTGTEAEICRALAAMDQTYTDYLSARRQRGDTPNPRPQLPLRRLFHEHLALDPLTGEELHLPVHTTQSETEVLDQLAQTMHRIAMYRVLAKYLQ